MPLAPLLDRLRLDSNFMKHVVAWERLPACPAQYSPFPAGLSPRLRDALNARGIARLYSHQSEAVSAALAGENVVVVTGTASGKTLCYNLPVLQALLADENARALYLFPTKALAQDQAAELGGFLAGLEVASPSTLHSPPSTLHSPLSTLHSPLSTLHSAISVRIYDGDTPASHRAAIRRQAQLLITNPDMLHMGILPHHTQWAELFAGLKFVVLDEMHTYRGVFGSHVANLIRRLRRICRFYGASPRFICASATIANPRQLAERLIEAPVTLVERDGSPRAEKHFILYNPPVFDPALGVRRAYTLEAKTLAGEFLDADVQTVVFGRARLTVEVLLGYLRDEAQKRGLDPALVRGYRGGYLPDERRAIERGLRDGSVRGVVATNALELGVDIGQLGAAVIAGYPGTIASLWQQAGRAGRRSETSAAVFVASGAPLDQYIAAHPRYIFEQSPEHGLIDPDNLAILVKHLRCAAFELPFEAGETFGGFGDIGELLEILREDGDLHRSNEMYHWIADAYPAEGVSLRSAGDDTVVIQDVGADRPLVIGEMDTATAPIHIHEGAVYLHEGRQYLVEKLDWEARLASVRAADVNYYTDAAEAVDVTVTETRDADEARPARRAHGRVRIVSHATSYRKVKRYSHETLGYGVIDLPPRELETTAYWSWPSLEVVAQLQAEGVLLAPNDYGPNWDEQRNRARARDGYRCRQCGAAESADFPDYPEMSGRSGKSADSGRQHHVHHLRPFREFGYVRGRNDNYLAANALDNLITLCPTCHHRLETARGTRSALGGLAHALGNLAPLFLMCDPRDIAVAAEQRDRALKAPAVYIYDRAPDGLGFSALLYDRHAELLSGALDLVSGCPCQGGCPACIGPVHAGGEAKEATLRLLKSLCSA